MKLTCHPVSGPLPAIRPAPTDRPWMDASPEAFAYRCLPLTIANAHGWEILNPRRFSAVWDGRPEQDAIQISCFGGPAPAISHFGSGVLTFHVNALFKTEEGVNLWVGGPPNRPKDGIFPLTGIVETDWSPYTFTMNWLFTRPGQTVTFEYGEPFAFFFPLSIELIEATEPVVRPLSDDTPLEANHAAWVGSRREFNSTLSTPESPAAKQKWQKRYHRGINPDGTPGSLEHRTKIRLRHFSEPS